jgi:HK97 family phage prohead protease
MLHKSIESPDTRVDAEAGTFEATVAIFNNVDKIGDRIRPGAFKKTLERWAATGDPIPVIFNHDWGSPDAHVGVVEEAMETEKGLFVKGRLDIADNPVAKQVHRLMARRSLREFSFGYSIPKGGEKRAKDGATDLLEIDLAEVGPTLKGMNPATELHAVKSALGVEEPPDPDVLRKEAERVAREETEARFPDVPPIEVEPEPDLAQELEETKSRLAEVEQELESLKKKAEVTDKEPPVRSVDPLRKHADQVALEFAAGGVPKPPNVPAPKRLEPELELGDLKKRMREEILVHLSGGTLQ